MWLCFPMLGFKLSRVNERGPGDITGISLNMATAIVPIKTGIPLLNVSPNVVMRHNTKIYHGFLHNPLPDSKPRSIRLMKWTMPVLHIHIALQHNKSWSQWIQILRLVLESVLIYFVRDSNTLTCSEEMENNRNHHSPTQPTHPHPHFPFKIPQKIHLPAHWKIICIQY